MILRGNFGLSESGKGLRAILVGVQLVVSIALMIFVLFVQRQSRYMQEYPCGYDKDNLAVVDPEKCVGCGHCADICPRHIINWLGNK